ncbi:acyltransferase [Bacteriovorax sp. BSW11_IV]|uniref:acyltransferase family protein n=1 Tax=Bacteriovorax sp. BSW11_IV TaxID=1353529 RepID=UPI000389DF94|nr:acyltransferase [Bacteriovorax sp. BSW11_IV]EQC45807.1 acyltransferase [Bacteriovorax sp. BSW11_IV]
MSRFSNFLNSSLDDNGQNNNWNLLRLFLALIVLFGHFPSAAEVMYFIHQKLKLNFLDGDFAVKSFFIISGLLISSSYLNSKSFMKYSLKRFFRIYPPIVITVTVVLLSSIYYGINEREYLLSVFNMLAFQDMMPMVGGKIFNLPEHGRYYAHGAFWTLVVEVQFYILAPFLLFFKDKRYFHYISLILFLYSGYCSEVIHQSYYSAETLNYALSFRTSFFSFASYFLSGIYLKLFFDRIKKRKTFAFLILFSIPMFYDKFYGHILSPWIHSFSYPIVLAILVLAVGLFIPAIKIKMPDVSYGVYIYHFPIFSITTAIGLNKLGNPYLEFFSIFGLCILFSLLSYYLIENKFINFAKKIKASN